MLNTYTSLYQLNAADDDNYDNTTNGKKWWLSIASSCFSYKYLT